MPASFLKIGGELVQDAILQFVEVAQELNCHWWCSVECRQTEDRRIPVENLLGQDLQIVTRDQAGAEHVVFDGFILETSLLYEVFGSYTARLKAVTRSYKIGLAAQEAYHRKQTLSGVARALCGAGGLTASVLPQDGPPHNYVQWGEPDFQFLVRLADDRRAWVRPSAGGIEIRDAFQSGAKVTWRQEDGLLEFDVEGALAPLTFDGTHYDPRRMRSVTHSAIDATAGYYPSSAPFVAAATRESKAQFPPGAAVLDERAATADEYQSLLERESLRAAANQVIGHGASQKEDLRAGDTVEIEGVLDGKGIYGLTKVVHRWSREGYRNEFWCTPAKVWLPPQRPAYSEMAGVVTARVVDQNDPRRMGRVQVQYDWQENGRTGWVRAASPHAGQDRGFLFLPEVGDEVVIAFEQGDAERPYVVGCLWNGVDRAPREEFWGDDVAPNDVKRIVTKSGHRIQLIDKPGKESIVIATPQHLKISLIEKTDETGRSAILLHSDGDIFINAPGGRVHLHSATLSEEVGGGGSMPANVTAAPITSGAVIRGSLAPSEGRTSARASAAAKLLQKAAASAKQITPELQNLGRKLGGRMVGLEHRLKTQASLTRKIATLGRNPERAAASITDALRYTMVFPASELPSKTNAAIAELEKAGYKKINVRNTWQSGTPYKGVNTVFMHPNGQVIELQFHTPASFEMKEKTHPLYEKQRSSDTSAREKETLKDQMARISDALEFPNQIESVKNYPPQRRRSETG